jgi:hypothetical protein
VDSYYIVGDGNDTMSILQFKLNEEATKFELKTHCMMVIGLRVAMVTMYEV